MSVEGWIKSILFLFTSIAKTETVEYKEPFDKQSQYTHCSVTISVNFEKREENSLCQKTLLELLIDDM